MFLSGIVVATLLAIAALLLMPRGAREDPAESPAAARQDATSALAERAGCRNAETTEAASIAEFDFAGWAMPEDPILVDPAIACDLLTVAFRSGCSVPGALESLGVAAGEGGLARCGRLLRLGASWSEAMSQTSAQWRVVVTPLQGAWERGIDPTNALAVAAAHTRAQRSSSARIAAERLAVRLVLPLGICLLPAFVLLGIVPVVLALSGGLLSG